MAKSSIGSFARSLVAAGAVSGALGATAVSAATFDLGVLPTDGNTLSFAGTTRAAGAEDVYNFTLAETIQGGDLPDFLRLETVAASFDTVIELFDARDLGGKLIAASIDNGLTPCGAGECSTIHAGGGQAPFEMGPDVLAAGDYSLRVRGFAGAFGDYTLEVTNLQVAPVPLPAPALLLLGGLAAAAAALRRRSARA